MRSLRAANIRQRWSNNRSRCLAICVLAGVLVPTLVRGQSLPEPMMTVGKSGLHTIFPGHSLVVTVSEVGSATSVSDVSIEFRDAADQRRGLRTGTLMRGQPLQAEVPIPAGAGSQQLRVIVKVTPLTDGGGSAPIVGVEDIDKVTGNVGEKPPTGPWIPGGKWEAHCGGWHITRFAVPQGASVP